MTRKMAMASLSGLMADHTKVIGKTESNTEMVCMLLQMVLKSMENGMKARDIDGSAETEMAATNDACI